MIEILCFAWVIGWLTMLGVTVVVDMKNGKDEYAKNLFICLIAWPILLGAMLAARWMR